MPNTYSRAYFLGLRKKTKKIRLPQDSFNAIKSLGLLKPKRGGLKYRIKCEKRRAEKRTAGKEGKTSINGLHSTADDEPRLPHKSLQFLKVQYINARSVRNKTDEISELLQDNNLDILIITETWLRPSDTDTIVTRSLTPAGYKMLNQPRPGSRGGGGVAVILRENIRTLQQTSDPYPSFEILEVLVTTNSDCFRLCVIYRPPGISVTDFCEDFENFIDSLATKSGKLLLVGDFNIHVDDFTNLSADKFRAVLDAANLDQLVTEATHDKRHSRPCDYKAGGVGSC